MLQSSRFGAGRSALLATVLGVGLAACQTPAPTLTNQPAPGGEGLYMLDNAAVNLAAARPDVDWGSYHSIIISELVVPDAVLDATPSSVSRRNAGGLGASWVVPRSDGDRLAQEFRTQVAREFQAGGELQVVDTPGPGTLMLRTQLTNIELAAPIEASRSPGTRRVFSQGAGSLSIAGDLVDSQTGQVLAQFADNRMPSRDTWQVNNRVTNLADASRIFRRWGVLFRGALMRAQAGNVASG